MQEDICVQETPVMVTPIKPYKMIATRGVVVFPGDTVSFEIIRDKSLAALQKASESGEDIFVVSQKYCLPSSRRQKIYTESERW